MTEKQVIDNLGNWLCTDMEKDLIKSHICDGFISTDKANKLMLIRDVAKRIQFYRDYILDDTK